VLGGGASGGVAAADLRVVRDVALDQRCNVTLVEQPYRVAGRRAPAPPRQLDAAWTAVIVKLRERMLEGLPLITGGRSMGARVACRTAAQTNAAAVLCPAFPLHPPGRREAGRRPSRIEELTMFDAPCLIVQGTRDPFGMPPAGANRAVVKVDADHSLKSDLDAVAGAVGDWLRAVLDGKLCRS